MDERHYVVCLNEEQAKKDRADREAIVAAQREQLRHGDKSLVGNKRFLLRSDLEGTSAAVFRAVGVAIPPSVQRVSD